ncbi:MAG: nitronate monooxygenase [Candidatus Paceibacterota bacterium]|jgi:NAD(P)H-dependent flavin oxidoreductase YrpB (nitropropane dioxygenase family)
MKSLNVLPRIIQGGMGVNISSPHLARTVSLLGERGTISGVALERLITRMLQVGDPSGDIRRALSHFPFPEVAKKIVDMYFVPGGIPKGSQFKATPVFTINPSHLLISLTVCANFAFVWLAKENNPNPISVNFLEKIAMPHVYAATGAIMAGVDFVTMGAGIPLQIPKLLDDIVAGREVSYRLPVEGKNITSHMMTFDPAKFFGGALPPMKRPGFIPIIASNLLANIFMKKLPAGSVQGFVVEEWTAGGHNAPPRKPIFNDEGKIQPIYGEKDVVNYPDLASLGVPFWIGGSYASPEKLKWALSVGAAGIQAGSIFALCEESNMDPVIRARIRKLGFEGKLVVRTDMQISPTGFPFKVVELEGTISEPAVYEARTRICDQGELVVLYERPDGKIGYRCPSEPFDKFVRKGGKLEETIGRGCLCNGLITTAGLGDIEEAAVVTLGDDVSFLPSLMANAEGSYSAADAIKYLLG